MNAEEILVPVALGVGAYFILSNIGEGDRNNFPRGGGGGGYVDFGKYALPIGETQKKAKKEPQVVYNIKVEPPQVNAIPQGHIVTKKKPADENKVKEATPSEIRNIEAQAKKEMNASNRNVLYDPNHGFLYRKEGNEVRGYSIAPKKAQIEVLRDEFRLYNTGQQKIWAYGRWI